MEKTIIVHMDEKDIEIPVKASMMALETYRAQFNADLIRDLNSVYQSLNPDPFADAMKKASINPGSMSEEELVNAILKNVDYSILNNQETLPDYETQLKALQILWAMAKAADRDVEKFDKWRERFDLLPIRALINRCYEIWTAANAVTVDVKN